MTEDEYFDNFSGLDDRSFFSAFITEKVGSSPDWPQIKELVERKAAFFVRDIEEHPPIGFGMATTVKNYSKVGTLMK